MPINQNFQKNRKKIGEDNGVTIWGPVDPPEILGIRGTYVVVDWDLCIGCGICVKVCPLQVYDWVETVDHPVSEKKAFPARELNCVLCQKCDTQCPVQAIKTVYQPNFWTDWLFFPLLLVQLIGGSISGVWFGPSLGLQTLFYIGWGILVLGILFLLLSLTVLSQRGEPREGKNLMFSTVLVESGTYGIMRHPQSLGMILMIYASIFVSQHWLFVLIGVSLTLMFLNKFIKDEEEHLIAKFGDDYRQYMERVPRMNLFLGILRFVKRRRENGTV